MCGTWPYDSFNTNDAINSFRMFTRVHCAFKLMHNEVTQVKEKQIISTKSEHILFLPAYTDKVQKKKNENI